MRICGDRRRAHGELRVLQHRRQADARSPRSEQEHGGWRRNGKSRAPVPRICRRRDRAPIRSSRRRTDRDERRSRTPAPHVVRQAPLSRNDSCGAVEKPRHLRQGDRAPIIEDACRTSPAQHRRKGRRRRRIKRLSGRSPALASSAAPPAAALRDARGRRARQTDWRVAHWCCGRETAGRGNPIETRSSSPSAARSPLSALGPGANRIWHIEPAAPAARRPESRPRREAALTVRGLRQRPRSWL